MNISQTWLDEHDQYKYIALNERANMWYDRNYVEWVLSFVAHPVLLIAVPTLSTVLELVVHNVD